MNNLLTLFLARRLPFYYGWIMLAVAMLIHICSAPGQTYGISVFNPYFREELGLSASQLGGAYMAATLLAGLPLTLVGSLMDRYGTRTALLIVVSLLGVTCVSVSRVSGIWSLFMVFFCLRFLAQGSMGLLAANSMAMWFSRRLGFASGLANMGMAASFGLIPLLNLFLIQEFGWRTTYILLGVSVCIILIPLLLLLYRNRPEEMGLELDGGPLDPQDGPEPSTAPLQSARSFTLRAAMRSRSFWLLAAVTSSWSMTSTGVQFEMVSLFQERGLDASDAVRAFSIYAAIMAMCHPLAGYLADRVPLNLMLSFGVLCLSTGLGFIGALSGNWLAYCFPAALAVGSGLTTAVSGTIWVRYYGRGHIGKIRGFIATVGVVSSGVGPFLLGISFDFLGGFLPMLWGFCGLVGVLGIASLFATPPSIVQEP
jgi:sugar phosphate permease